MKAVGLGAGGHAKAMIDALSRRGDVEVIGLLDVNREMHGRTVLGVPVLGGDELLPRFAEERCVFFVAVGGTSDTRLRSSLYGEAIRAGLEPIGVIHPTAYVSSSATLGPAVCVLAYAFVGPGAKLEENVLVNTHAVVEHDAFVGANAHIAVSAKILGGAIVKRGALVGAGAAVLGEVRVGEEAVVGAGAVVVRSVEPGDVVVGVPARRIDRRRSRRTGEFVSHDREEERER